MTPDRVVSLQGGWNFRDLGGCETVDGGRVRRSLVFRSGGLHRLTADDLVTLDRLGLRVVYDLRLDEERDLAPSQVPAGIRCEFLPIGGAAATMADLDDIVVHGPLIQVPDDFLARVYVALVEASAPAFGSLLTRLAEPGGLPALFHCTAGKDRTGVAAALLLSVLGVDDEVILDDYELSAVHYTDRKMETLRTTLTEADVEQYRSVFGAPRHAMRSLLTTLRERHGSVAGYLMHEAGVTPGVLRALRSHLVH
jgi:protein-tyrosine phosphatase